MKCLKCGGMQMLRYEHTGGGIYWLCPRCNSTTESTSNSEDKTVDKFIIPHSKAEQELNLHNNLADLGII